jgi:hypothetical protein
MFTTSTTQISVLFQLLWVKHYTFYLVFVSIIYPFLFSSIGFDTSLTVWRSTNRASGIHDIFFGGLVKSVNQNVQIQLKCNSPYIKFSTLVQTSLNLYLYFVKRCPGPCHEVTNTRGEKTQFQSLCTFLDFLCRDSKPEPSNIQMTGALQ